MAGAKCTIQFDMRSFVNHIRYNNTVDEILSLSENSELREAINRDIYYEILASDSSIPIYTGALIDSPDENAQGEHSVEVINKNGTTTTYTNVANGGIDAKGIHFNPYHISTKTGQAYYYGLKAMPKAYTMLEEGDTTNFEILEIVERHIVQKAKEIIDG